MAKYISNRVQRTSQTGITSDRYQYLGLNQAEPNLGDPLVGPSSIGVNPIPVGQVYQPVSVDTKLGERYWTPLVGFGTTVGVISVYQNGVLPGGSNQFQTIHGLNFVGTGVTIDVPPLNGPFAGVGIATIRFELDRLTNKGDVGRLVYNSPSGYVDGATNFYYDSINSYVGIGTSTPGYNLDVNGAFRLRGALRDFNNQPGTTGQLLQSIGTGVSWVSFSLPDSNYASKAGIATYAEVAGIATYASVAGVATYASVAGIASYTDRVGVATYATLAGVATYATIAGVATYATYAAKAGIATYADNAGISTNIKGGATGSLPYQSASGITTFLAASAVDGYVLEYDTATNAPRWVAPTGLTVTFANNAGVATYASVAGIATFATRAGVATYASVAGIATYASIAGIATFATRTGVSTYADRAGIATFATTAGVSTNINGGAAGSIPYQFTTGITSFLAASGTNGFILEYNTATNAPRWVAPSGLSISYANNAGFATYANRAGLATYADNAGISTNVKGGAAGSLVYQSASGVTTFLAASGTNGFILEYNTATNAPRWVTPSGLTINYANNAGIATYATRAGLATYADNAGISTNIKGGATGSIPYQFTTGITSFLAASLIDGYILEYDTATNAPKWVAPTDLTINYVNKAGVATYADRAGIATFATNAGLSTNIKGGNSGQLVYQTAVDTSGFISTTGATGKFLLFNGTLPVWSDIPGISTISVVADSTNTTRYIPFVDDIGTGTTVRANSTFVFNPGSQRVGIGTTNPTQNLDVNGTVRIRGGLYDFNNLVGVAGSILISTGAGVSWATPSAISGAGNSLTVTADSANANRFLVLSSTSTNAGVTTALVDGEIVYNPSTNSLGINTTTLSNTLTVAGSGTSTTQLFVSGVSTFAGLTTVTGPTLFTRQLNVSGVSTFNGNVILGDATTDTVTYTARVGSGITPSTDIAFDLGSSSLRWNNIYANTIVGTLTGAASSISVNPDTTTATSRFIAFTENSSGVTSVRTNTNLTFIPSTSRFGINVATPTQNLDVNGTLRIRGGLYDFNNLVGVAGSVLISTGAGVSWTTPASTTIASELASANVFFPVFTPISTGSTSIYYSADNKFEFQPSSGTLYATAFTSLSDETQKTDIKPIENALDIVNQLQGVKYKWLDNTQESIGLIAQEVEKVLPEVVTTNANGLKTVSYGNIIGVLIEAIKEQQVRIEELEKKLNG